MKKSQSFLYVILGLFILTSCMNSGDMDDIKIYSRDNSSGTREAFEAIIELKELSSNSAETSGNADMAKQVASSENAIGYVSMGTDFALNDLKAIKYNNIPANVDTVNDGSYDLARSFSYVTRASKDFDSSEKEALVKAFITYLTESTEAKEIILNQGGIVDINQGKPWKDLAKDHPIVEQDNSHLILKTGGSTSVEKTLHKTVESFIPLAGNFKFEPHHSGSGDGYKRTLGEEKTGPNQIDIGFASRDFKENEIVENGMMHGSYSKDAVIVVVNKKNTHINSLSKEQLRSIFSGEIKKWGELE